MTEANLPVIVDESGKKLAAPEMEAVTKLVTQLAEVAQLARIRKSLEREHIEGKLVEKTLSATDTAGIFRLLEEYPYTAWATASLLNDGPDEVYISINNAWDWNKLKKGEVSNLDFTKADRRIELIYYKCDTSKTASVRAKGKY